MTNKEWIKQARDNELALFLALHEASIECKDCQFLKTRNEIPSWKHTFTCVDCITVWLNKEAEMHNVLSLEDPCFLPE